MLTEIYNDTISQVNYSYFSECKNNRAIQIYYKTTISNVLLLSSFKNDDCGLNNVWLKTDIDLTNE